MISKERLEAEVEFYAKYGNIEKTVKMPVPPTCEETKIEDFIKSNKTKPDNYKELFAFYLNNELFNLEIYSDENCKYFITISDDNCYYKPLFEKPITKDIYYKALDKTVKLWCDNPDLRLFREREKVTNDLEQKDQRIAELEKQNKQFD